MLHPTPLVSRSPRHSLWCLHKKNPTNLIKQYFSVLSFLLLWLWGWSCGKISKIRHIVCQRGEKNAWNQQKIKAPAMVKILWQRKRLGEQLAMGENYFFYYYCWHFIWLLCVIWGRYVEPACTPCSIKMIWCKYKWDWIFLGLHFADSLPTQHSLIVCPHILLSLSSSSSYSIYLCESCDCAKPLCTSSSQRKSLT